jgi:hypothetical protein
MENTAQSKPGLLRRTYRWLFSWRTARRLLIAFVALITLIAAFYAEENWRGKRAWEECKRELEAKGEKLDIPGFAPAAVPDERNLAMAPLFKPVFEYRYTSNHVEWLNTNGLARFQKFSSATVELKEDALGNIEKGSLADLGRIRSILEANTKLAPVSAGVSNNAEAVLMSLKIFEGELKELQTEAQRRPECRFPIDYDYDPPMAILLPHLAHLKGLARTLQIRIVAELELGRADIALADLKLLSRIVDASRDEPFLISHLVRLALTTYELNSIREGIARHAWTIEQLRELERRLSSFDLLSEYQHTMRGERALNIAGLEFYRRRWFIDMSQLYGETEAPVTLGSTFQGMPSGWFYRNDILIANWHQEFTLELVNPQEHRVYPALHRQMIKATQQVRTTPSTIFAKMLFPALANAWNRSGQTQTRVDRALLACVLERYQRAHGEYPETLQELVESKFIDRIPNDVIDGLPLRYKKKPNGFLLYSIGANEKDDGGVVVLKKSGSTPNIDSQLSDWVWQMPPADSQNATKEIKQ